jgi:hypothetical protein
MKKTLYTFLLVSIIFAACKKEEEEIVTPVTPLIVGTWTPTDISVDYSYTVTVMGVVVEEYAGNETMTPTDEEWDFPTSVEFTTDGKMYVDDGDGDRETNSYTYSGNLLTVTDEEGTETNTCTVTSTSLAIIFSDTETYTEDWDGQEATITESNDMTLNCTRQ